MDHFVRLRASVTLFVLMFSGVALAQSAADKATARKLATEGIELYGDGKYTEALDKLDRAQALYDAPVHLVYIARAQAKLGMLVESAETYRRLIRVELAPNAPAASRDAVDSAKREISDVEAKIGSLKVEVTPANLPGLKLTIDGQDVPPAIVGVERPANPGRHSVQASAPGYHSASGTADVGVAGKESIRLTLSPDPNAVTRDSATGAASAGGGSSASDVAEEALQSPRERRRDDPHGLNLFVGVRVGGAFPGGTLYDGGNGTEVATADYFKTGAMLELNAGAWFAGYFGAKAFVEGGTFSPGGALNALREFDNRAAKVENRTSARGFGLSAMVGTLPRRFGVTGELGVVFAQELAVTRTFDAENDPCGSSFEQKLAFSGPGLRIGGAARIPFGDYFQLSPYVLASFGQTNTVTNESKCSTIAKSTFWPKSGNESDTVTHHMIIVGIGADGLFGLR